MTYCFDLDGTLCSHEKNYIEAKPYHNRISLVNKLYRKGHTIIINTARGSTTGRNWETSTKEQLICWGLKYHTLYVGTKPTADYYIDDKAIHSDKFFPNKRLETIKTMIKKHLVAIYGVYFILFFFCTFYSFQLHEALIILAATIFGALAGPLGTIITSVIAAIIILIL